MTDEAQELGDDGRIGASGAGRALVGDRQRQT
ncbi:hypothetical protein J2S47_006734 [Streptomyces griseoviridis]|uniref:Uncharacterized protein n=1 Tax=Streptomyces griseoviridis TaxID=45398 RepID=A0ABT9LRU0_STRGD|nr:hypothetical protein [Streptomyces griseoviridis]